MTDNHQHHFRRPFSEEGNGSSTSHTSFFRTQLTADLISKQTQGSPRFCFYSQQRDAYKIINSIKTPKSNNVLCIAPRPPPVRRWAARAADGGGGGGGGLPSGRSAGEAVATSPAGEPGIPATGARPSGGEGPAARGFEHVSETSRGCTHMTRHEDPIYRITTVCTRVQVWRVYSGAQAGAARAAAAASGPRWAKLGA